MTEEFWRGRSVLVTGHSGFKGAWLCAWLVELGARVHGFSHLPPDPAGPFDLAQAGPVTLGDVRDLPRLARAMAEAEVVFHLAAQSLVRRSYGEPAETFGTNVMGTVNVLEAARQHPGVRAVIVVTSDKCYENAELGQPFRETDRLGGRDPYSSSKACCELVAAAYRSSFAGPRIATVRAGNVLGGGDWSPDRLVPDILRGRAAGSTLDVRAPDSVRPWQHVLEPLSGYLMLAEALLGAQGDAMARAWNFGPADQDCVPVGWIVERLCDRLGVRWRRSDRSGPHEAQTLRVDSTDARTLLRWRPRLRLDEALDWTAEWYLAAAGGHDPALCTRSHINRWRAISADAAAA